MALNRRTKAVSTQEGKPSTSKAEKAESVIDALCAAISKGHSNKAKIFLQNVPDVNSIGELGRTPLACAVEVGNRKLVDLLLEHGADVNGRDDFGETPIYMAISEANMELAKLLLAHGAKLNVASDPGGLTQASTPLHWAVEVCSTEIVRLFLAHGASTKAKDSGGATPLDIAVANNFHDIAALLRRHREKQTAPGGIVILGKREGVFQPRKNTKFKFVFGRLSRQTCERLNIEHPAILFMFGTGRSIAGNPFPVNRDKSLTYEEYKSKIGITKTGGVAIDELCAGFHLLLALTGWSGGGAHLAPEDLGWPADWQKQLKGERKKVA